MSNTDDRQRLGHLLSPERLSSYMRASEGDIDAAFTLYEWNMRASAAVTMTTGMVEIIVRNALDRELRRWADERGYRSWLESVPLDDRGVADIAKARMRATRDGRDPRAHGKVVAELTFGFWRYLVASRYLTSLWTPALHEAFPGGHSDITQRRRHVDTELQRLMLVRNRAAHHEPIFRRDLRADRTSALRIASWIDPAAAQWVDRISDLDAIYDARPPTVDPQIPRSA